LRLPAASGRVLSLLLFGNAIVFDHDFSSIRQRVLCWVAFPVLLLAGSAAAGPIEAPMEVLHSSSNVLIAAKLVRIDPDGRVEFLRKDVLSGEASPADRIAFDVEPEVLARVKSGRRYVLGYSIYIRDPHNRKAKIPNPRGPTLVSSPGLEPALFDDSRALRALLRAGRTDEGRHSSDYLGLLLKAVEGDDRPLQNLAAHEFAYDPDVSAPLDAAQQAALRATVDNPESLPAARIALLQAALHKPDRFGDWWRPAAQNIVTTTPVDGYIAQSEGLDGVVMAAFSVLQAGKATLPDESLVRWVAGPSPAISERALLMLRKQTPELERSSIKRALANPALPTQTRTFLTGHLRRLDSIETKLRNRPDAAG
jgi:hypothetical protein